MVTDHNGFEGAVSAQVLDPERVIVGEETMTTQGELLAAFLKSRVPPHLSLRDLSPGSASKVRL